MSTDDTNSTNNCLESAVGFAGSSSFLIFGGALVFMMIIGIGFFYGGQARSRHFLSTQMSSLIAIATITIQWFVCGYSFALSHTSTSRFIGNIDNFGLWNIEGEDQCHPNAPRAPETTYCFFELMFAIITPAIAFGAVAERATLFGYSIFCFIWSTLVYDVCAYWVWQHNGWLRYHGMIDFAGGCPVHLVGGVAALAYCLVIGPRHDYRTATLQPHNLGYLALGAAFLWFGWFGFNGASTFFAGTQAGTTVLNLQIAASFGAFSWIALRACMRKPPQMVYDFCSGAIAGLVTITPGSGYVYPAVSCVFGLLGGAASFFAQSLKYKFDFDDSFDVFAIHGVSGALGSILTGVFASQYIMSLDPATAENLDPGWWSGHMVQVPIQLMGVTVITIYTFVMTALILTVMKCLRIPLAMTPGEQKQGDDYLTGETAYFELEEKAA